MRQLAEVGQEETTLAETTTGRPSPTLQETVGGAVDALWRFFCSLKLALALILAIAVACLAGTLLMQAPAGLAPDDYAQWLARLRPRYGAFTDVFSALGLLGVFDVWWFRTLLALLTISVVVCTLDRWPRSWRAMIRPGVRPPASFFEQAANRAAFAESRVPPGTATEAVALALRRLGYRVRREDDGERSYVYADRGWYSRLGTYLNHLSIVLLLAGTVVGGLWGIRDRDFAVPEGSTREVGRGTNLAVRVDAFVDEYYPAGPPKDYRSDIVVFENGVEVTRGTVRVNEPVVYKDVRFHQSFFGPAVVLRVATPDGRVLFEDGIALAWRSVAGERPIGAVTIPSQNVTIEVVGPSSARREPDPLIPAGQVRLQVYRAGGSRPESNELIALGKPKRIGSLEYTFLRERQFTGLQVVKDPGGPIIWIASTLMIVGVTLAFGVSHRRFWLRCATGAAGETRVDLAAPSDRSYTFGQEFRRVAEAVRRELEARRGEAGGKVAQPV